MRSEDTSEQTTVRSDEGYVCAVALALNPGDEVIINDRSRPLTVLGYEKQTNPGLIKSTFYPAHIQWLRGNRTEYRLRWSHKGEYWPRLHTESELETTESFSVKHQEPRTKTRATGRGERVRSISVVGVDDADLSEWALAQNVVEVSTDADD